MKDEKLKNGKLQFITHYTERYSYLDAAHMALEGGCRWVQLRMKDTSMEDIEPVALEMQSLCRQYGATFIIDDHVELAGKLHADGVHLGKKDMPIADTRRILGKEYIIGGTANTLEDVLQHYEAGADYIGCGPFRYTTTKKNLSPILDAGGRYTPSSCCHRRNYDSGYSCRHAGGRKRDCPFRHGIARRQSDKGDEKNHLFNGEWRMRNEE